MRLAASICLAAVLSAAGAARAATFGVDPTHTSVVFSISHLGYSYTYGMFRSAGGVVEFDKDNLAAAKFTFEVDVTSLDTLNEQRDAHLLNADFFNAEEFAKITYVSKKVEAAGEEKGKPLYHVTGDLTMLGVTKEVVLPIQLLKEGPTPFNDYRIGFHCQTTVDRTDFGIGQPGGGVGEKVGVTVSFEGVRQ